jgi:hypothetical protein
MCYNLFFFHGITAEFGQGYPLLQRILHPFQNSSVVQEHADGAMPSQCVFILYTTEKERRWNGKKQTVNNLVENTFLHSEKEWRDQNSYSILPPVLIQRRPKNVLIL